LLGARHRRLFVRISAYNFDRVRSRDCGTDQLTSWLKRHALASQRADLARTYLALDDEQVIGYTSLTTGSVRRDEAPKRYARGMPATLSRRSLSRASQLTAATKAGSSEAACSPRRCGSR
jgi:hypothetical protein